MSGEGQINQAISFITEVVDNLTEGKCDTQKCAQAGEVFETLREHYRRDALSFEKYTLKLTELRRRFDDLMAVHLTKVVDRYYEITKQIDCINKEKEFWRNFLIQQANGTQRSEYRGSQSVAIVRSLTSRIVPPAGSEQRRLLEDVVTETRLWPQVGQISRTRLQRALNKGLFTEKQISVVEQLCPVMVMHQISCRNLKVTSGDRSE